MIKTVSDGGSVSAALTSAPDDALLYDPAALPPTPLTEDDFWQQVSNGAIWLLIDGQFSADVPGHCQRLGAENWRAITVPDVDEENRYRPPVLARADQKLIRLLQQPAADGAPWGYGVTANAGVSLPQMAQHWRYWSTIDDGTAKAKLFRFFDPRIVTTFITSSTDVEVSAFYGKDVATLILPLMPAVVLDDQSVGPWLVLHAPQTSSEAAETKATQGAYPFLLSAAHLTAFEDLRLPQEYQKLLSFLAINNRHHLLRRGADDSAQLRWVARSVPQAFGHGFTSEHDVALYLVIMLVIGDDFASVHPWAVEILAHPGPSGPRLNALLDAASAYERSMGDAAP
jgi:hypothetical protein